MRLEDQTQKVIEILELLAAGKYDQLEEISNGVRLSAGQLQGAVEEYGCKLVPFPNRQADLIDMVEIAGSTPRSWSVWVPVFTAEEGRSDLTLQMTLIEEVEGQFTVELDNLVVP